MDGGLHVSVTGVSVLFYEYDYDRLVCRSLSSLNKFILMNKFVGASVV